jgi:hypothetical protein
MELKRALELHTEYAGSVGVIRVDADDYICLNELNAFFPDQRLDVWQKSDKTKNFIACVETEYKLPPNGGIISKRGRNGGTWAHPMIAFEFATWLSPEFKLKVYREYIEGRQHKQDWNIKRILAANNYKMMTDAIKNDHEKPMPYHYSNEALMLNEIVFGVRDKELRDTATEDQLDAIAKLEQHNATMIILDMDYQKRKEKLKEIHNKLYKPKQIA